MSVSFGNKTGLKSINRSIRLILFIKKPFGTNNVCFGRPRNKILGAIFMESVKFFIYSSEPCRVFGSSLESMGLRCSEEGM